MDIIILSELATALALPRHEVTPDSTFHGMGGDSITALRVAASCKSRGVALDVSSILGSRNVSEIMQGARWTSVKEASAGATQTENRDAVAPSNPSDIPASNGANGQKASRDAHDEHTGFCQLDEGVAHHTQDNPVRKKVQTGACNMPDLQSYLVLGARARPGNNIISYFQEISPFRVAALKRAWQQVICSEPIFRTAFDNTAFWDTGIVTFSWSETIYHDKSQFLKGLESVDAPKAAEPATEFQIKTLADERSVLIWHVHHALVDGYSAHILLRKVNILLGGGQIVDGFPFADLARGWQMYRTIRREQELRFWQEYLTDVTAIDNDLLLPPPHDRYNESEALPGAAVFSAPRDRIVQYSEANDVPITAIYYAAWAMVLSIYTGSDSVIFGVVFANRSLPIPNIRDTVGPMMNTLPLPLLVKRDETPHALVQETAKKLARLGEFEWSVPDRRCLAVSSVLAMQYDYEHIIHTTSSWTKIRTSVPINLFLGPKDGIQINFDRKLYDASDIEQLGQMYVHAVDAILTSKPTTLLQYFEQPMPADMWKKVMWNGNCSSIQSRGGDHDTLISLFDARLRETPDDLAVTRGEVRMTYAELGEASQKVASHLLDFVTKGDVVCVHADRSVNWIIGIYAILRAQAVYCPIDPTTPADLRDDLFRVSGSRLFLSTSDDTCEDYKPKSANMCRSVEELLLCAKDSDALYSLACAPRLSEKSVAYLCFTSGSSGLPKGVSCTHEGIVAFQKDYDARLRMRPRLKVAQIMSPAFDGSMHEIFSAISYGGTILLSETANAVDALEKADVAMLTPSIAKILSPRDHRHLEAIYMVGEHLPQAVSDAWSSIMPTFNLYGPTESSCGSTCKKIVCGEKVTIGRPVQSTRIYILDERQRPLPPGVIGEIHTAGVQVSPGYIKRPEETARNFLMDSICPDTNQRMYRTRDRGYWNRSGEICLLGRSDRQVKLRGFRLDLDDLEIRMTRCSSATSVALSRKNDILVAMVLPENTDVASFREAVRKHLPPQALPRLVKPVQRFPLGNSGKIDYKAVVAAFSTPEPETQSPLHDSAAASPAKDDVRHIIASVWKAVLNLDHSHVLNDDSSFRDLGGHSLEQMTLAQRLSSTLRTHVSLADVLQNVSFGDQVKKLGSCHATSVNGHQAKTTNGAAPDNPTEHSVSELKTGPALGCTALSPIERDWLHKYGLGKGSSSFNVNFVCALSPETDMKSLELAWNQSLARHSILSSIFTSHDHRTYAKSPPRVTFADEVDVPQEINREFRLDEELPLRVIMTPTVLVLVASHIVMDLTALDVLLSDVQAHHRGEAPKGRPRTYSQTMQWSRPIAREDLAFWDHLSDVRPHAEPTRSNYGGRSRVCKLPLETARAAFRFSSRSGITPHQLCLAAVALALRHDDKRDSDGRPAILGAPYLNRGAEDLETVGLFLEPMVIRVQDPWASQVNAPTQPSQSWAASFCKQVAAASQQALSHAIPWHKLLERHGVRPNHPNVPFIEAMVTFHDNRRRSLLPLDGVEPLYTWCQGAKFKLMFEVLALSDETAMVRMEYDSGLFDETQASRIQARVVAGVGGLARNMGRRDVQELMAQASRQEGHPSDDGGRYFGIRLAELSKT